MKQKETAELYRYKQEILREFESLSENRLIDLYYADQSRVAIEPCVPYGWQFPEEEVFMPSAKGGGLNCFARLDENQ